MPSPLRTPPRLLPLALGLSLLAAPAALSAQGADPATAGPLYEELARLDSVLFDAGFVSCDAAKVVSLFSDDVEFYHDVSGMAVGQQVRDQFTQLTARCPRAQGVRRELVPGTLRVYPMNHYGAVQTGTHRFVHDDGEPTGIAMFTHLWRRVDGEWKITRVISYDHRSEPASPAADPED